MGKLMLDKVGPDLQYFIKDSSRHCPETVAGHFVLVKTHTAKRRKYGVVAHRPGKGPAEGKTYLLVAGQLVEFLQYLYGLSRKVGLGGLAFIFIFGMPEYSTPLRQGRSLTILLSEFPRTDKEQWGKP